MRSKPVRLRRKAPRRVRAPYVKKSKRNRGAPKRRPRAIAACKSIKEIIDAARACPNDGEGWADATIDQIYALACGPLKPEGPK